MCNNKIITEPTKQGKTSKKKKTIHFLTASMRCLHLLSLSIHSRASCLICGGGM